MTNSHVQPTGYGQDIEFGYIDRSVISPRRFHPELVLNSGNSSMLRALRTEMRRSSSFAFSVAFISPRAIALLKQEFIDFVGVGRIITSDYLGFNSPQAFAELLNLREIGLDVRLSKESAFHPKGYVFQRPDGITAILGSSNLTAGALASNHEWNLRVSASRDSDLAEQFSNLLDQELFGSDPLTPEWIENYARDYQAPAARKSVTPSKQSVSEIGDIEEPSPAGQSPLPPLEPSVDRPAGNAVTPNVMQVDALRAIASVRESGKDRALVISATGTGKTILSALDVREVKPNRMLFVAHREQILDRAITEFQRVLAAPIREFGKLSGSSRQLDRKYLFATVQSLSQDEVLEQLAPETFDYILIDEVHRAGATSFTKVLSHFRPLFMLGMTATPERTDGRNIFELFDFNVPYEIRLNSALELGMLAPFHYYGVADLTFADGTSTSEATELSRLVSTERVDHVLDAIGKYGQAGVSPRGLIFCSRNQEALQLSKELNTRIFRGRQLRTRALSGNDSIEEREEAVRQLEAGEVDYLLTVDIFNEGVDIPTVNQVVMLRQTQSSIVFVQQLGRGLRKAEGKEYLVVIDFIGNYANNYLIPIALFGDDSLNKESIRKTLIASQEAGVITGLSSVSFDRISQQRILRSLATVRLDSMQNLKAAIESVKNRLGRTPRLADFLRFESADPVVLATKTGNYPDLLARLKIVENGLSKMELDALSVVSREFLAAKRPHELVLVRQLILDGYLDTGSAIEALSQHQIVAGPELATAVFRSLTLDFNTAAEVQAFNGAKPASWSGESRIELDPTFASSYAHSEEFKEGIDDLIETGLSLDAGDVSSTNPFIRGRQYSRKDASRLLNWRTNMYSTIYGYKVDYETATCPVFITFHKSDEISASTDYEDELLSPTVLQWFTRSRTNLATKDVARIADNTVAIHVFAKQSDADGAGHYYLGKATSEDALETTMPGKDGQPLSVVRMHLRFDLPIQAGLFDYFQSRLSLDERELINRP